MVKQKTLKTKVIRESGRSSDYIFPTILQGCFGECQYCYAARHNPTSFYKDIQVSVNLDEIIDLVKNYNPLVVKPNQTHNQYVTWDIAVNSDLVAALHLFDWKKLFDYFKYSTRDLGTFATKFVNPLLLTYNPERKLRVRSTLLPETISEKLELKTAKIQQRIEYLNKMYTAGYEVHLNFSPVVYYKGWSEDYKQLFQQIDTTLSNAVKDQLACEVIFLTHNEQLHKYNLLSQKDESNLWIPELQEDKVSKFGGSNIRYKWRYKDMLIAEFQGLIKEYLPYCKIRYIF